jgi:hypothetical protein
LARPIALLFAKIIWEELTADFADLADKKFSTTDFMDLTAMKFSTPGFTDLTHKHLEVEAHPALKSVCVCEYSVSFSPGYSEK